MSVLLLSSLYTWEILWWELRIFRKWSQILHEMWFSAVYDLDENGERIKLPSGRWKSHKEDQDRGQAHGPVRSRLSEICLRAGADHQGNDEDPPVRHHVRAHHQPCG